MTLLWVLLLPVVSVVAFSRQSPRVIGRQRQGPLDVLRDSRAAKDVRRAETAWRRAWDGAPPPEECDLALRALGTVKDGTRIEALLRKLTREDGGFAFSESAAISSLALAGARESASARLSAAVAGGSRPDVVALGLAGTAEDARACGADRLAANFARSRDACVALFFMQRTGFLDCHGLDGPAATLAVDLVLDDPEAILGDTTQPLLVVTGRGAHSAGGVSAVKEDVRRRLGDRGAAFEVANEGAVRVDVAPSPRTTHGNPLSGRNGFAEIGVCMCEHGDEAPS